MSERRAITEPATDPAHTYAGATTNALGPLLACEDCDTLYRESQLSSGDVALCKRCGRVLLRGLVPDIRVTFALSLTACVLNVLANVYPVINVQVNGLQGEATLSQSALAMAHGPFVPVAVFVGLSMIVIPTAQIALVCWISGHAWRGRNAAGLRTALRIIEKLRPWSMIEVFLVGALVALVKLSSFLEVRPGLGLFSLFGLTLLLPLLGGHRTRSLWRRVSLRGGQSGEPPGIRL